MYENTYYPQETLRRALTTSFVWMALGLLVTAATSYLCYSTGWYLWMLTSMPMIGLLLFIVQIGLVFAFQSAMQRSTATGIKVLFMVYAVTFGISLTSLLYTNSQAQLTAAFLISAVYFICLAFIGLTTKKNLNSIGMICVIGLTVLIISQAVMLLFGVSFDTRMISIVGLLLFTGITAWDIQRMNKILYLSNGDVVSQEKIAIYMALELYLDFLNIFLYILRLLGYNRD